MSDSKLTEHARTVLCRYTHCENASRTLLPLWCRFEDYLMTLGPLPPTILEIPAESLRTYANFLDRQDTHVDDALIALAAALLICLHAGYGADVLRTIVIPRVRRPVENRRYESFRARTYQPLDTSQLARARKRRAKREEHTTAASGISESTS